MIELRMNIEAERARLGKSKEDIAKLLGISSKTYVGYTRENPIPSDVLEKMVELFDCSADYLLGINKPAS